MTRRSTLSYMAWLSLLTVVPLLVLVWLGLRSGLQVARGDMARSAETTATIATYQLERFFAETRTEMERLARLPEVRQADEKALRLVFSAFMSSHPDYANITFVNEDAQYYFTHYPLPGNPSYAAVTQSPIMREALAAPGYTITNAALSTIRKSWAVALVAPVTADGRPAGRLIVPIDLPALSQKLLRGFDTEAIEVFILGQDGTVVMASKNPAETIGRRPDGEAAAWLKTAGATGVLEASTVFDGKPRYCVLRPIAGTPLLAVASVETAVALAGAHRTVWIHLFIAGGLVLITGFVLVANARGITRRMQAVAAAVTKGESSGPVPVPAGSTKELEGVINSFNRVISHLKQAEEEHLAMQQRAQKSERTQSLGLLAGGIAHDFNNLLTGIIGHMQLIELDVTDRPQAARSLAHAQHAAQRAKELCRQILAFSGRGSRGPGLIDLNLLIQDTVSLLQASTKNAALHLTLTDQPAATTGDSVQVRQIVMNLLVNAVEAMDGKQGNIWLATDRVQREGRADDELKPGAYLRVVVRDDGSGMTPEVLAKIFEPFYTTKANGTGIGLSSAVRIMREHGGWIGAESEPGRGTAFTLLFPVHDGAATAAETETGEFWRGRGRVLIVDDDQSSRDAFARLLKAHGLEVELAETGQQAVALCRRDAGRFQAVLLDLTLPDMEGPEALQLLRKTGVSAAFVLMTGLQEGKLLQPIAAGTYAAFLRKPGTVEEVLRCVRTALGGTERQAGTGVS